MRITDTAAILFLVTLAVFAPVWGHGFVYEDRRDAHLTLEPGQTHANPFRLVTQASRKLDLALFGVDAGGMHGMSVVYHAINVVLVLFVAWLALPPWGAILAAGLFAVHPIQVEAVSYVSARADLLAGYGLLLALFAASLGSATGAVLGVVLASLAKETAVVAWGLVFLWAAWASQAAFLRRWALLSLAGVLVGVSVLLTFFADVHIVPDIDAMGRQLATVWRLVLLLPFPVGFSIDHDWAAVAWLGPVAFIGSMGLTAWALTDGWWNRRWLAFAWLWTLVALSPRLVVPLYEGLHERHMYPVVIGWALCAGAWLTKTRAIQG